MLLLGYVGRRQAGKGTADFYGVAHFEVRAVTFVWNSQLRRSTKLEAAVLDPTASEYSLEDIQNTFAKVIIGCTVGAVVCRALVLRGGGVIFCYLSISFSAVSRPNFTSKYSFFSIFQDLQDPHTFAPLHIQNLQIFSNFSLKNNEFSRFFQIFGEICLNLHFFAEIFTDFYRNCGKC